MKYLAKGAHQQAFASKRKTVRYDDFGKFV